MIVIIKRGLNYSEYYEIQYDTESKKFYNCFRDGMKKYHKVEIDKKIADIYIKSWSADKKIEHEIERHIEHSEVYENNLNSRAMDKPLSLEDEIIRKSTFKDLKNAIKELPEIQQRRIKMYYFDEMNMIQMEEKEHCSKVAIKYSLDNAIEKLKEIIKN